MKLSPRTSWRRLGIVLLAVVLVAFAVGRRWGGVSREARWQAIGAAARAGRWKDAEARLDDWVADFPGDGNARVMLGGLLGNRGRESQARAVLERVARSDPAWARAQTCLAEMALKAHRADEAIRAYRAAADGDRRAVDPRRRLVYLLGLEQRDDEARAVLRELYELTRDPRDLVTRVGLAVVEWDARDVGPELDRFLEQTPDDPWLHRARGLTLLRLGRPAEARGHLERAAGSLEDDPRGRAALAESLILLDDLRDFDAALGPQPPPTRPADLGRWWLLRGRADEERGRAADTTECWRQAIAADLENRDAQYRLGQDLVRRGDEAAARPYLDRAEALRARDRALKAALDRQLAGGENAQAFERLGRLCLDAGLLADAKGWFEQTIRLDPTRQEAQSALAQIVVPPDPPQAPPRLRSAAVKVAKAVTTAAPVNKLPVRFEDVAAAAGLVFQYDSGARGDLFIGDTMGGGVGLIDYDEDGRLDVYFVNGCKLPVDPNAPARPNRLFRNRGDGRFEDVTERAGVAGRGYGMGCAVGDYDGDGHDDLFVTGLGSTVLYRNQGGGRFEDVTERAGVGSSRWTTAAGFGDLDGDGDLDLVAVTYVEADPRQIPDCRDQLGKPIHCQPGRFPAQFDHLYRNNGNGTFTDVSAEAGLDVPGGDGLGLAIADLDEDGRLDLFVANDATPNFLFHNLGGLRFEEVGVTSGVAYDGTGRATASMGVVADDLDGDGRIDLFHTNFNNEPNTLLRNLGGGQFLDVTTHSGLDAPSRAMTGFGTEALDADNDGRLDLFVANGHVDDQPWFQVPMAQRSQLFLGQRGGRFVEALAAAGPYFARTAVARGAVAGDLDEDGRVDLVVVHRDVPAVLLSNRSDSGHWLAVRLRGKAPATTPIGARVRCEAGGRRSVRWLSSGTSYLSSGDPRLRFGLGAAATVDQVEVRWPSGKVEWWPGPPVDRTIELREGTGTAGPPRENGSL